MEGDRSRVRQRTHHDGNKGVDAGGRQNARPSSANHRNKPENILGVEIPVCQEALLRVSSSSWNAYTHKRTRTQDNPGKADDGSKQSAQTERILE